MGQAKLRKEEIIALKAGPEYFYHGTTAESAEEIIKVGFLDPKKSVENKNNNQVVMVTDSLESAVNITTVRKTQDLNQEVVVFKIHNSKLDKSKTFESNGTKQISIMKNFKGWGHFGPISILDAEVIYAKPTFKLPKGVAFTREGNKTGFTIAHDVTLEEFAEAAMFCGL